MHASPARDKKDKDERSRLELLTDQGLEPEMPLLGEVSYLASWWQDAGLVQQGAMGAVPISASELRAWADGRLIHLAAWEFQTMLDLSREFVAYGRKAPEEPAPYRHDGQDGREPEPDRDAVSRKVASILSARSKTKR